ncbi:MAG: DNA repair protein RecO [Candidatus Hydrogenedentota bacterium]
MSQERTEAVVLKAIDFSETSSIVTLFSPDRGRLTCMAKGVKRSKSQLAGLLDTLNRLEVLYTWKDSRGVQLMTDGTLLERYSGIKDNLDKSLYSAFLTELILRMVHENEPSFELFDTFVDGLAQFEDWTGEVCSFAAWQAIRILSVAGFSPVLDSCCVCGNRVDADAGLSYAGGVTCLTCPFDVEMNRGMVQTLRMLAKGSTCPSLVGAERVFGLLTRYASRQLECELKSVRVIDEMLGRN